MNIHTKWFRSLPYKKQWNLAINMMNHVDSLNDAEILQIYNEQHPPLRKNIDIKVKDVEPLQILAVKAGKDLKNYIQDVLSEHVLKAKK